MADLLFSGFEKNVFAAEVSFSLLKNAIATGAGNRATFDSCHCFAISLLGDQKPNALVIGFID